MKTHKPTKRTIWINNYKYFLDFPELLENNNEYAIKIDGKFYHLPLPNVFSNNLICYGVEGPKNFWTSRFSKYYLSEINIPSYIVWQNKGFDSIKKYLIEMPFFASINFIENPTQEQKLSAIEESFGYSIKYFPDADLELQKAAILKSNEAIYYINKDVLKEEVILDQLKLYRSLKNININNISFAMKKYAIEINPENILHIIGYQSPNIEKELALMAVKKDSSLYKCLRYYDHLYNDKEIQLVATNAMTKNI